MRRLQGVPAIARRADRVEARLYNLWRRARMYRLLPLRVSLPAMAEMVLIVERDGWVVVDRNRNEVPVLAWVEFHDQGRDRLHDPVECSLHYYHFMASGLRGRVLEILETALEQQLHKHRITPDFPRPS
jgi:hypothetical protein